MAESGRVRLVRCPRCKHILPERPDVPVYRCGKCDVTLQAKKNRKSGGDGKSETSSGESVEMVSMESGDLFENESENSNNRNDISDADVKSNGGPLNSGNRGYVAERNLDHSKARADKWVIDTALDTNTDRDEPGSVKMAMATGGLKSHVPKIAGTSWASDGSSDWQFRTNPRMDVGRGMGYSHSIHSDVGPSDYGYGDPLRDREEYFEPNQARVIRQLNELKDRFERSCDVGDKPKEKALLNRRVFHGEAYDGDWFSTSSSGGRSSMPSFMPDKSVPEPPYFQHYDEPFPYNGRYEKGMQGSHHPFMPDSNHNPRYEDFYGPQMLRQRPPPDQAPVQYQRRPPHAYFSGGYMGPDSNSYEPYMHGFAPNLHHPSCSCFHCYTRHQQVAGSIPANALFNRRFPDIPSDPMSYHPEHPVAFHPQIYNPRTAAPPSMTSYDSRSHSRSPSEVNIEKSDAGHRVPQRGVLLNGRRCCRPFAGGAPFITCCSCFELLKLPKKVRHVKKNQQKIQCGACSKIIFLAVNRHGIVASIHEETEETSKEIDDGAKQLAIESPSKSRGHVNKYSENFSSEDFDNTAYDYQSMDREAGSVQADRLLNSRAQNLHSPTNSPEIEASQKGLVSPSEADYPLEQPTKPIRSPPPPGSTLQELFDYSSNNIQLNHFGNGNHSNHSDHKKVISPKPVSRQSSVKDVSVVTETEVSYNEFSNTGVSQDSMDASREHDQLRINKGGDTFLAGIIEGLRESSRPSQTIEQGRNIVMVNDHIIPDNLVQKAEKLAGPIQPGEYWYDFYCGFWGVMGGRCLGIIPPFIEEFKYPMPINCAAGNTGVWVNERELNQKDLDLLVSRGLPATRDREYTIDISGRVQDRDSNEELKSLGRLAPTVEKAKRGFGMKFPRSTT